MDISGLDNFKVTKDDSVFVFLTATSSHGLWQEISEMQNYTVWQRHERI